MLFLMRTPPRKAAQHNTSGGASTHSQPGHSLGPSSAHLRGSYTKSTLGGSGHGPNSQGNGHGKERPRSGQSR